METEKTFSIADLTVKTVLSDTSLRKAGSNPIVQSVCKHGEDISSYSNTHYLSLDNKDKYLLNFAFGELEMYFLIGIEEENMFLSSLSFPAVPRRKNSFQILGMYLSRIERKMTNLGVMQKCLLYTGVTLPYLIKEWAEKQNVSVHCFEQFCDYQKYKRPVTDFYFCSEFKLVFVNNYDAKVWPRSLTED